MKKMIFCILILAAVCAFTGCASTPSESVYKEKKQSEKKLRFDDWKYMGFGSEIPLWVEPALDGNISKIKKIIPELTEAQIEVRSANGINIDQAEEALNEIVMPENFSVYDSFWVRQSRDSDKPYIAVAIYKEN